jgi:hypothetical protein
MSMSDEQQRILFLTEELVALRRPQREQLASFPQWVFERLQMDFSKLPGLPKPRFAPLLEMQFRREAETHLKEIGPFLESGRISNAAKDMASFLDGAGVALSSPNTEQLIGPLYNRADKEVRAENATVSRLPDNNVACWKGIVYLALADVLAEDGYFDPVLLTVQSPSAPG